MSADRAFVRLLVLMTSPRDSMISRLISPSSSSTSRMTLRPCWYHSLRFRAPASLPGPRAACYPGRPPMQTTDIRKGLKIQIDGVPYAVVEHQFVKPGKGQSFTRCRVKNLTTGNVIERTWKSGESVELADVE